MSGEATIKFACRHCGQSIEAAIEVAGTTIDCPTCGEKFRAPSAMLPIPKRTSRAPFIATCLVLIAIGLFLFYRKSSRAWDEHMAEVERERAEHPEKYESATGRQLRYRDEAEAAMLKECSNYVGFTRVLDHYVLTSDISVSNWTGSATIDFINKVGGVERTNLLFMCFEADHHCLVILDEAAMWNRLMKHEAEADGRQWSPR